MTRARFPRILARVSLLSLGLALGLAFSTWNVVAAGSLDPTITSYFGSYGWAAQTHANGHDGYGGSNFPTWYGGTDTISVDDWYPGSPIGTNACGSSDRYLKVQSAGSASTSSTDSQTETPDWDDGLVMSYVGCNVSHTSRTLMTEWVDTTGGGSPGYNFKVSSTSTQCSSQGMSHPCGNWSSRSEIDDDWWDTNQSTYGVRLLMHEWGHSWGLGDYFGSNLPAMHHPYSADWPSGNEYVDIDDYGLYLIYGQ